MATATRRGSSRMPEAAEAVEAAAVPARRRKWLRRGRGWCPLIPDAGANTWQEEATECR